MMAWITYTAIRFVLILCVMVFIGKILVHMGWAVIT